MGGFGFFRREGAFRLHYNHSVVVHRRIEEDDQCGRETEANPSLMRSRNVASEAFIGVW
jgi:hypothetical protein